MRLIKLVSRNIVKNIRDYAIYYSTLTISVALFYSFNSIHSQPALNELDATRQLMSEQMSNLISSLSVVIAIALAFLIIYANQFLLKRRKKELGIYILLGLEKNRISAIFVGEILGIGLISLISGILLGLILSQGLSIVSLRLFAIDINKFVMILSIDALKMSVFCFAVIYLIVILFNVITITKVNLIDLLNAVRKNETLNVNSKVIQVISFIISIIMVALSAGIINKNGIMPSHENVWFQVALILLGIGTILFFYSISAVLFSIIQTNKKMYLKGLNVFLVRQIGSRIHTNYITMSVICGLLVVSMCGISVGVSAAITMNETSKSALPYDLNVVSEVDISGDTNISEWLQTKQINTNEIAEYAEQISIYEADYTYEQMFAGQKIELWPIDKEIPKFAVTIISISDFNKAMEIQGKDKIQLMDDEFLVNCNYKGTSIYVKKFLENAKSITLNGEILKPASRTILEETYLMTSVGNNDRGTLIVPDNIAKNLCKIENVLLVDYKPNTNSDAVLQKMIPIGMEWEKHGYRYTEKNMLNSMYYGSSAIWVFICSYIGLIFLLICAALLSLKQLTETADNGYRYGLLQKIGADEKLIDRTLFKQIGIFFVIPLFVSCVFSAFGINKIIAVVEDFMNMHIATNIGGTIIVFLLIYGGYFIITYISCRRIIKEKHIDYMEKG